MQQQDKLKYAIIGTGVVGTAFAVLLHKAGLDCIGVNTRSRSSYERFKAYLPIQHLGLEEILLKADLIFITTQDKVIEKVAGHLTSIGNRKEEQHWIHCSGSLRSEVMCKDPSLPVNYLSIHPLHAFATVEHTLTQIKGTHFGIEGSNSAGEALGEDIVRMLGGIPHRIDPKQKTLYHAGAVVASNYLVSLASFAVELFGMAGISEEDALSSLLPLMEGSYQNIAKVGLPCALTGPIARGDAEVVERHLQKIPPDFHEAYQSLGRIALDLGIKKMVLDGKSYCPDGLNKLRHLLQ